jgi:hypothetical protein
MQLIVANVLRPQMVWRLVEVPGEVCHGFGLRTDRQPRIIPQLKILDHSLAQFRHERAPFTRSLFTSRMRSGSPPAGLTVVQQPFSPATAARSYGMQFGHYLEDESEEIKAVHSQSQCHGSGDMNIDRVTAIRIISTIRDLGSRAGSLRSGNSSRNAGMCSSRKFAPDPRPAWNARRRRS